MAFPAASYAAEAASAKAPSVQELVVTAQKREENLRDVPQSVTAISGETLSIQRAVGFQDYVSRVPGMALIASQPGSNRLVLRGINAGGVSATIGTYVDETPYGSVTGLANGAIHAPDFDTFDMRRIEVLRGPQGTLYGASSLGGLLKFVTNPPDPSAMSGRLDSEIDSTNSAATGGAIKGVVNLPLSDRAAIRVGGYYDNQPGFIDDPLRHVRNVNGATYTGLRLGFLVRPIDKLSIRLSAVGQNIDGKGTNTEDVNRTTLSPLYGDLTQSRTFSSPNKIEYRIYNATIDYDFGPADLVSATSYGTLHQDTNQDASAQLGALLSTIFKQPVGSNVLQFLDQKKFTQEIRLASPAQKFEWLVGGFFTREDNVLNQNLSAISIPNAPQVVPGLGGLQTVILKSNYLEYAAFANADYHFTDRFDVSLGGRISRNDQHDNQLNGGPLAGGASLVTGRSSENVFTFAVAPKYKLNDDTTLYARVAKGYRPGGPNALNPLVPLAVPRVFESDSIINYEVGVKGDVGRAITYELTGFFITWDKIQLLANVGGFGVNTNGGSAESKGVEGAVTWAATTELTLSATGAYTEAHLTAATGPLLGGHDGDRLPYSSPITGSLNADYNHPLAGDTSLFLGASVGFTGRRRSDFNATIGQISVPAFTTVDLRGGVTIRAYRIEAFVKNLTDERGILSLAGFGSTPAGALQAGLVRPRTVGVALSANF
ncbi:TonB-dependent receptor [Phenylobacterium sp.]|uniref:TonB-dependent receptor n=1 Tax=Phenylobacterium sp. TaxID=1871053 RepID=UPI003562DAE4